VFVREDSTLSLDINNTIYSCLKSFCLPPLSCLFFWLILQPWWLKWHDLLVFQRTARCYIPNRILLRCMFIYFSKKTWFTSNLTSISWGGGSAFLLTIYTFYNMAASEMLTRKSCQLSQVSLDNLCNSPPNIHKNTLNENIMTHFPWWNLFYVSTKLNY
jgi:hypothetical protein